MMYVTTAARQWGKLTKRDDDDDDDDELELMRTRSK